MSRIKTRLTRLLPQVVVDRLKRLRDQSQVRLQRWLTNTARRAALFYTLRTRYFDREQRAVLYGRMRYTESLWDTDESRYVLRRNIHHLEKGLISRPRRGVFAKDYIGDTVGFFTRCVGRLDGEIGGALDLQWARDVLARYFAVTDPDPVIDAARARFEALGMETDKQFTPYCRDLTVPPPVEYEALLQLAHRRRAVRWFEDRPVPRDLIDKAMAVAAQSPSACNRQPFEFYFFDDKEAVERVAGIPVGTKGFSGNFPAVAVVVGKLRAYFDERDRHVIYIDGALAAMSFMFALETLGLSSCPINWPDVEHAEQDMAATLGLEPDERPVIVIAIGYPDPAGEVPYSQKKSLAELRRYNLVDR